MAELGSLLKQRGGSGEMYCSVTCTYKYMCAIVNSLVIIFTYSKGKNQFDLLWLHVLPLKDPFAKGKWICINESQFMYLMKELNNLLRILLIVVLSL